MYEYENQENLLQGVQLTTSISCHYPSEASNHSKFEHSESHSFRMEDQDFYLSSNEDQESSTSINMSSNFNLSQTQIKGKSAFAKLNSQKKRLNRQSNKKHLRQRRESDRKLSKLINLDNKLVQIKLSGLFDHSFEVINRLTQIILTQQFCKYRVYEKKLLQMVKDLEFCMSQFQKQKKSLMNQINLLKSDNQNLKSTVYVLTNIIKQLQQSFERFSVKNQKNIQSFLFNSTLSKDRRKEDIQHSVSSFVSYDKSQETIQQSKKSKQVQIGIDIDNFTQNITEISQKLNKICENQAALINSHQQKVKKNSESASFLKNQMKSILASVQKLEGYRSQSIMTFAGKNSEQIKDEKLITKFLTTMARNNPRFLKKIEQSENKAKQFWFIVHSSLFTFIGILINQAKNQTTGIEQTDNKQYCKRFVDQILLLKQKSSIIFKQSQEIYMTNMWSLLNDIDEFTNSRSTKQ